MFLVTSVEYTALPRLNFVEAELSLGLAITNLFKNSEKGFRIGSDPPPVQSRTEVWLFFFTLSLVGSSLLLEVILGARNVFHGSVRLLIKDNMDKFLNRSVVYQSASTFHDKQLVGLNSLHDVILGVSYVFLSSKDQTSS